MNLWKFVSDRPISVKIGSGLVLMGLVAGGIAAASISGTDRLGTMVEATDVATGILVKTSSVAGHVDAVDRHRDFLPARSAKRRVDVAEAVYGGIGDRVQAVGKLNPNVAGPCFALLRAAGDDQLASGCAFRHPHDHQ